eukprot:4931461-Heterocapsa_arctica.AAC.1
MGMGDSRSTTGSTEHLRPTRDHAAGQPRRSADRQLPAVRAGSAHHEMDCPEGHLWTSGTPHGVLA